MSNTAACRILVIASTTDRAQQFVQHIKALSTPSTLSSAAESTPPAQDVARTEVNQMDDVKTTNIPWTIVNKYYTANVHFQTIEYTSFAGYHASNVPAIIYVWDRGEPYKENILALSQKLEYYDPEVLLAVRFAPSNTHSVVLQDEEDDLDEFLSSNGFEFIEGDRQGRRPTQDGRSFSDEDNTGVPGLPRVIDALSTIMWPSLVQSSANSTRKSRARELLDWAREEEGEDGLRALISQQPDEDAQSESGTSHGDKPDTGILTKSRMQREMEELERWLEEDDVGRRKMEDAEVWGGVRSSTRLSDTEGWGDVPTPVVLTPAADKTTFGFEDDFAEFIGAPLEVSYSPSRPSPQHLVPLKPAHTGASYKSLASEFNDDDIFDKDAEKDDDFPSREEIEEASRRIFGQGSTVPDSSKKPSTSEPPSKQDSDTNSFVPLQDDSFSTLSDSEYLEDDDYEMGAFDLSRVLGALQGMKEEIAGMTDEGERRKAAARVALGLVYGLRKEGEGDDGSGR